MASASTIQPTPASEKSQYFDAPIMIIKSSGDDTSGTVAPGPDRAAPASIVGSAPTKSGSAAIAESKSPKDSHGTTGVSRVRSLLTKRRSLKKKPPPADETKASAPIVTSGTIPPATKSSISNPGQTDSSKFQDPISAAIDCAIVKDAANAANTSSEPTSPRMQPQTTAPSMPVPQTLESFTSRIANESIEPELSRTYLPPAQTQSPREPHSETFAKTTSPLASNATGETKSIIAPSTKSRASRAANTTGDAPTEHLSRRASHRSNKSYRSRRSHRSHASRRHDRDYERDYDHGRRHKQSRSAPGSRRGPVSDDETASESDSATGSDFESVESDEADEAGYMSPVSHNRRAHRERGSRYDDDRRSRRSSMPARPRSMHHGHEHDEDRDQRTESGMKRSGTAMSRRSMAVSTVSTSGGAFASGAGTIGPGALPDPGDAEPFRTRAVDAARNLSTKQAKKITKEELKEGKRLSKVLKQEGKAEKQAIEIAIKELGELQYAQKKAIKEEMRTHTAHSKALKVAHAAELVFLEAQRKFQVAQAGERASAEALESARAHGERVTSRVQQKNREVEMLRVQKAADVREREVKRATLLGKAK